MTNMQVSTDREWLLLKWIRHESQCSPECDGKTSWLTSLMPDANYTIFLSVEMIIVSDWNSFSDLAERNCKTTCCILTNHSSPSLGGARDRLACSTWQHHHCMFLLTVRQHGFRNESDPGTIHRHLRVCLFPAHRYRGGVSKNHIVCRGGRLTHGCN